MVHQAGAVQAWILDTASAIDGIGGDSGGKRHRISRPGVIETGAGTARVDEATMIHLAAIGEDVEAINLPGASSTTRVLSVGQRCARQDSASTGPHLRKRQCLPGQMEQLSRLNATQTASRSFGLLSDGHSHHRQDQAEHSYTTDFATDLLVAYATLRRIGQI